MLLCRMNFGLMGITVEIVFALSSRTVSPDEPVGEKYCMLLQHPGCLSRGVDRNSSKLAVHFAVYNNNTFPLLGDIFGKTQKDAGAILKVRGACMPALLGRYTVATSCN